MLAHPNPRARARRTLTAVAIAALAGAVLMGAKPGGGAGGSSGGAQVRVDQVGYPTAGGKRAYLMSGPAETGATFAVKSGATSVFSAAVGADLGA